MTNNQKPGTLTPRTIGLAALIALAAVAVVAVFMLSPASALAGGESSCEAAADYHYREAIKAEPGAQDHFWAGAAAETLEKKGEDCGWVAPEA
jgi:hypothetical protein